MRTIGPWALALVMAFITAGCHAQPASTPTPSSASIPASTPAAQPAPAVAASEAVPCQNEGECVTPMTASPQSAPSGDPSQQAAAQAAEDLAHRLAIPAADVTLLEVRPFTWPDASLGCPQPGMMYAQVTQAGLVIRLRAGGRMYAYHAGPDLRPFLCENSPLLLPRSTPKFDEFVPPPDSPID